jgi:ABC-2 type transport system permease protein
MLRNVFGKVVHDQWRAILGWAVFAGVWPLLYVGLYPSIGGSEMQQLMDQMPEALRAFFAAGDLNIGTAEGYLNVELFSFVAPLLLQAVAVVTGAGATAGEEERGTIDLLLANPIRRWRVVVEKSFAVAVATAVVAAGIWLGIAIGAFAADVELDLARVAGAVVSALLLALALGGIALALGALTGRRMPAIALTMALAVAAYFLNALAPLVEELEPWRPLSLFYYYIGNDPLTHGLELSHTAILAAVALAGVVVAVIAFERRDLRG